MNKSGQFEPARKTIYWMLASFVLTIIIIFFTFMIAGYKAKLTSYPPELESTLIVNRFLNVPECFAYKDPITGRIYPEVIDLSKFNQINMNNCYSSDKSKGYEDYNFRLYLEKKNVSLITNNYFQQDKFVIYRSVLVKEGDNYFKDMLNIYVQYKI